MWEHAALEILVAPLTPRAILPYKAHHTDAGFDLALPQDCQVVPQQLSRLDLEFILQIPHGWYGQIFGRSSVFQRGLIVHPGVIDADYRGTVQLLVFNKTSETQHLRRGERLAQLLVLPVPPVTLRCVTPTELSPTPRGTGGFGSTGR